MVYSGESDTDTGQVITPAIALSPIKSSMLTAIGYDAASHTLRIQYPNGALWDYADVPADVYEALQQTVVKAESVGKYVAAKVKPVYRATKVIEPVEAPPAN